MGTILKELEVAGDKGRARLQVLFDTGASRSLIRRDKAEPITTLLKAPIPFGSSPCLLPRPERERVGVRVLKYAPEFASVLYFTIKGYTFFHHFFITDELAHEVILGADAMQLCKIVPIPELEDVRIDPTVLDLELV